MQLDHKGHLDLLVHLEHLVMKDQLVGQAHADHKEIVVHLEDLGLQVVMEMMVLKVPLAPVELMVYLCVKHFLTSKYFNFCVTGTKWRSWSSWRHWCSRSSRAKWQ